MSLSKVSNEDLERKILEIMKIYTRGDEYKLHLSFLYYLIDYCDLPVDRFGDAVWDLIRTGKILVCEPAVDPDLIRLGESPSPEVVSFQVKLVSRGTR